MRRAQLFQILLLLALALPACDRDDGIQVYKVSKPDEVAPLAPTPAQPMPGLPGMAGTVPTPPPSAEAPKWELPAEWDEKAPGAMRQASFSAGQNGEVDISVTAFPGEVGGDLANVNRWRRQLGLDPIDETTLARDTQTVKTRETELKYVELPGADQATLAGWTLHHGQSWFFKMTGPKAAVAAEQARFRAFLESVTFHS